MRRCRPLLGTFVEVTADSADAIDAAFVAIERVHALMSAHDPESDVSRVNRLAHLQPVEVSGETLEVLERSLRWWRLSGGRFDVVRAGSEALRRGHIPLHAGQPDPDAADSSALSLSGSSVRLTTPACVDLGGIAKGFAVDQAIAAMRRVGALRGLVNAGGDLAAFGPEAWTVVVADPATRTPVAEVEILNEALTTSAVHKDGSASHLPLGGGWVSVTVRAPNACDGDALTKIVWLARDEASELLAMAGAAVFAITPDGAFEAFGDRALAA